MNIPLFYLNATQTARMCTFHDFSFLISAPRPADFHDPASLISQSKSFPWYLAASQYGIGWQWKRWAKLLNAVGSISDTSITSYQVCSPAPWWLTWWTSTIFFIKIWLGFRGYDCTPWDGDMGCVSLSNVMDIVRAVNMGYWPRLEIIELKLCVCMGQHNADISVPSIRFIAGCVCFGYDIKKHELWLANVMKKFRGYIMLGHDAIDDSIYPHLLLASHWFYYDRSPSGINDEWLGSDVMGGLTLWWKLFAL